MTYLFLGALPGLSATVLSLSTSEIPAWIENRGEKNTRRQKPCG